jgi:broad specificity phosphatase PhoE
LRERSNWGDQPGQAREEFIEQWEAASAHRDRVLPGGRSARATGDEVLDFCRSQPSGARIMAVTHGGAIGDCLLNLMPIEAVKEGHASFPDTEPCSITALRVGKGGIFVELVASSGHLSGI